VATNFLGTIDNVDFAIRANNTERMRIVGAGNVLVGTTTTPLASAAFAAVANPTFGVGALALANGGLALSVQQQNLNSTATVIQNTAADGTGTGQAIFARTNQTGTSVIGASLRNNTIYTNTAISAINSAPAGDGIIAESQSATGTAVDGINSAAAGTGVGFGGFFSSNQTGGSALVGSLGAASFLTNAGISGYAAASISGGFGVIGLSDNATGIGVQGQTTGAGASIGVSGINSGNNVQTVGVYGVSTNNTAGTGFTTNNCRKSIYGQGNSTTGSYRFGVYGNGGISTRSGGVIGHNSGGTFYSAGALGYYTSGGTDVAVYGFGAAYTAGAAGGFAPNQNFSSDLYASSEKGIGLIKKINSFNSDDEVMFHTWSDKSPNATVGLGIYGGVMGGWIKGLVYGTNLAGAKYGVYVHGKTITNNIITTLNDVGENKRIATYAPSSMKVDITERGKAKLINGNATIEFSEEFSKMLSEDEDITITVTPTGNCKGVYIDKYSTKGFTVTEFNGGNSNVNINWIAIGVKKGFENPKVSPEILDRDFETKMNGNQGVMYNDNNPVEPVYSIWYDGKNVRFDKPNITKEPVKPFIDPNNTKAITKKELTKIEFKNENEKSKEVENIDEKLNR
jgi:hypothetical protein